jgi:immune inhibitor A
MSESAHTRRRGTARAVWSDFCAVSPSPELRERLGTAVERLNSTAEELAGQFTVVKGPRRIGFDDGTIFPPEEFPLGTPFATIQSAAAERAPLRGSVRVAVILADFPDRAMTATKAHFEELFFSLGVLPNGSVREYFREVTHGLVDIVGEVTDPLRLPQNLAWYANGNFGIGRPSGTPRAQIMAQDAAIAADGPVNFGPYDNDGNGFVDAFIVVHAGSGGEVTGNSGDIWSHKWVLPAVRATDGTRIYAYLTIPEDARIGVSAHEIGHLVFGFPDLYDTDGTSEGIGNWCLMAGGSWGGGGEVPVHPSAWCKVNQGWATSRVHTGRSTVSFPDVKTSHTVHRLWKDGGGGPEYFLVENRQRTGYDRSLPGDGLLVWHIDEGRPGNTDENHYKVALEQADGRRDLELSRNRGDAGDPFPGSAGNTSFTAGTNPNSKSYSGADTCVSLTGISPSGPVMTATVSVSCGKPPVKELKELRKDGVKEPFKERKELKDLKEPFKERKDLKDRYEYKRPERPEPPRRGVEEEGASGPAGGEEVTEAIAELRSRLEAVEEILAAGGGQWTEPFIDSGLRPDLTGGPVYGEDAPERRRALEAGDPGAKQAFDGPPRQ